MKKKFFMPSKQDEVVFAAYVAIRHELLTKNGKINLPELIDRIMNDLASTFQQSGDEAYVRHACEKLGLLQPLCWACVMKGDKKIDKKVEVNNLPPMLATAAAMEIWKKAQEAGYIDENYQPQPSVSWAVASIIAYEVADTLQLPNTWRPFEELWHHKGLRKNYDGILNTNKQFVDIERKIRKLLTI